MIRKLIQNKNFNYSITSAALVMMIAILGTKVSGFIRQILYSQKFFGSAGLDIFYAANLIPEIIFNIIALGSISAVLIPIMTKAINKEGHEKASYVFSSIVNVGIMFLVGTSIIVMIFSKDIVLLAEHVGIIKKFSSSDIEQLVTMLRLLLISPVILGLSSVVSAILQIKRHFLITQLSPLVYNLSGILALFIFVPFFGIYGLAYGVIFGSLLHLIIQIPSFNTTDIKYHPGYVDLDNKYLRHTGKLMAPRLLSLAGDQVVLMVQTVIALVYPFGALSAFKIALTLRDIPISLFGTTLALAAFPTLSENAVEDDMTNFKKYFTRTFQQIVFLVLPTIAIIVILRLPLVRPFFVGEDLQIWNATKLTALIVFFMSFSIIWLSLVGHLTRAFYALSNTITPVIVSIISISIEIFCSIIFSNIFSYFPDTNLRNIISVFGQNDFWTMVSNPNPNGPAAVAGVAFATSIGAFFQVMILSILLSKKIRLFQKEFFAGIFKKVLSTILMGIAAYVTMRITEIFLPTDRVINVIALFCFSLIISGSVYALSEFLLNDEEFSLIKKVYLKVKGIVLHNKKTINQVYKSFIISQEKKRDKGI